MPSSSIIDHPPMSTEERTLRVRAIAQARASVRLEGTVLPLETEELNRQWAVKAFDPVEFIHYYGVSAFKDDWPRLRKSHATPGQAAAIEEPKTQAASVSQQGDHRCGGFPQAPRGRSRLQVFSPFARKSARKW